jgi:hypothetical protein
MKDLPQKEHLITEISVNSFTITVIKYSCCTQRRKEMQNQWEQREIYDGEVRKVHPDAAPKLLHSYLVSSRCCRHAVPGNPFVTRFTGPRARGGKQAKQVSQDMRCKAANFRDQLKSGITAWSMAFACPL